MIKMSGPYFDFSFSLLFCGTLCITVLIRFYVQKLLTGIKRLPPGPVGWPFVGFIWFIWSEKPTKLLSKLKKDYGNVFGFYVGRQYCVTLSDFLDTKEVFGKKSVSARPPRYLRTSVVKNFTELPVPQFEIQRRFILSCFKNLGVGRRRFEEIVHNELSRIIAQLTEQVDKPSFNFRDVISTGTSNAIFQIICSRWFEDIHPVMKSFTRFQILLAESFSNNTASLYYPWLDWFLCKFHPHYKAVNKSSNEIADFIRSEIRSREKTHNESSDHDYIDLYLNEMKGNKNEPGLYTVENLVANSSILLMGGSDTACNTIEWLFLAMAKFQDVQRKVFLEISSVIGLEKLPAYEDKVKLPYTEATVLESERWKTLDPLNVLRWASEDTNVQGYNIPKGTIIIQNLADCHRDPKYWESPKDFKPERFLSKDQTRVVIPEYFMPFSVGRRACPGEKMAAIEVFLYFCTIMQKFEIFAPDDGLCLRGCHRINLQPEKPFLKIKLR